MKIDESQATWVWELFGQLSRIPRPSKQEAKVCAWLEELAQGQGWVWQKDSVGNMVMEVPASGGYETAPVVILQAHTDMVCEKTPESEHDFNHDAIQRVEKEGWVYGEQTTLGADNGIGVCLALAVALEKKHPHPSLELLFTVDEETGLTGAHALTTEFVRGKRLINLDSEDEGVFTIGCAGGIRSDIELALTWNSVPQGFRAYELHVSGLAGGHSGVNIHEQRGNAIKLLTRFLDHLRDSVSLRLVDLQGGNADNALPRDGRAVVLLDRDSFEQALELLEKFTAEVRIEFGQTDPHLTISLSQAEQAEVAGALDLATTGAIVDLLMALPHGVQRFSQSFKGVVETSNNLAKIVTNTEKNCFVITTSQRSFIASCRDALTAQIHAVAALAGAHAKNSRGYPAWPPRENSELLAICRSLYQELTGQAAVVEVIHAGLECGIIESKYPGLDMISLGPTIENPHSPQERVQVKSVDKVWEFLVQLLVRLK